MIITVGTITIPTIPIMVTEEAVSAGASAWDLAWDGAWACPSDMDTLPIMGMVATIPLMVMEVTIPTMDMADTVATPIMEVPTGVDTTTDTTTGIITDITEAVDIILNIITITATGEWITGNTLVIPGPQKPLWAVQRELPRPIPGTGAVPVQALLLPLKQQQSGTAAQLPSALLPAM